MNIKSLFVVIALLCTQQLFAQSKSVSGTITDKASGETIPGVAVLLDGTTVGSFSDIDGKYSIEVPSTESILVYSFVGYTTQRITVGEQTSINVSLSAGVELDEVVVTALGVTREKKSLGYSVQELGNSTLSNARESNVISSMSGKVAGVQVYQSSNMGGSSRAIIRGQASITGDNNAMYVINGVPVDNSNFGSNDQKRAAGGYDYGTPMNDINPDDIESVTVLKGPAASALYGNRGSNGVILITTKSGKNYAASGRKGLGVEVNSSLSFQTVSILPEYQNEYGGGAGTNWIDTVGGAFVPDYGYDGSWGPAIEGQEVRHWDSWDSWDTENYGKSRAWESNENNVKDFFQTGTTFTNNFSIVGANENQSFRLSYTNHDQKGTQENSSIKKNILNFSGNSKITDKLTASTNVTYLTTKGKGRPITGYGESVMSQFNQWFQRQLDMDRLREYENPDGTMRTWNRVSAANGDAHYWDNPFWERYKNVQTDQRDRLFGNISLNYKFNDWLSFTGRAMTDYYTDVRQERVAIGGVRTPSYSEDVRRLRETNLDGMFNFKKELSENISLTGFVGVNQRRVGREYNLASTQGGLNMPGYYNLANSADSPVVDDKTYTWKENSIFGQLSFGFQRMLFLDLTLRNDFSSTLWSQNEELMKDNTGWFYPSASASYVFSESLDLNWLSFGKARLGWAKTGSPAADPYNTTQSYGVDPNFGTSPSAFVPNALFNDSLRPEFTTSLEAGLEFNLFLDRVRVDFTYYKNTTEDLIFNVTYPSASGYQSQTKNAGTVVNKGVELMLDLTPVLRENGLRWDIGFNWAKNNNELVELDGDLENLRYTSLFGVSLEARVGEPLGTFMGYDYVYDDSGNKLVNPDGTYVSTNEVVPIGTIQADWTGGVHTTISYKNISLYALVDMQKGGSLHSYSNQWGKYSGMLSETTENNIREDGIVVDGVYGYATYDDDGNATINYTDAGGEDVNSAVTNSTSLDAQSHFFFNQGYVIHAADQYDATFIKLREMRLTYSFPSKMTSKTPLDNVELSVYGRNLALLKSNVPHIDPEVAVSSSNVQGFEGGQLPAERSIGFSLRFKL